MARRARSACRPRCGLGPERRRLAALHPRRLRARRRHSRRDAARPGPRPRRGADGAVGERRHGGRRHERGRRGRNGARLARDARPGRPPPRRRRPGGARGRRAAEGRDRAARRKLCMGPLLEGSARWAATGAHSWRPATTPRGAAAPQRRAVPFCVCTERDEQAPWTEARVLERGAREQGIFIPEAYTLSSASPATDLPWTGTSAWTSCASPRRRRSARPGSWAAATQSPSTKARRAVRQTFDTVPIDGTIVVGEGGTRSRCSTPASASARAARAPTSPSTRSRPVDVRDRRLCARGHCSRRRGLAALDPGHLHGQDRLRAEGAA